jgi:2-phospho-L-lactate guanylyltransferase
LKLAIARVLEKGADEVLILPGDLPLIKTQDVENILAIGASPREVVIARSKNDGTNALFLRPPNVIDLRFGGRSFPLHMNEAIKAGIKPKIYRSETIELDVDKPEDLIKVKTLGLGTKTYDFLLSLE